ncbi:Pyruvate/Phosphoenolpyruvate kinase-like domain-containing protein [Mycena rebaudengoi]|nr:Pyruvate/Phosphoenolpyruvate kinase-like domain-containing protein [Mycena rebaudengoi]
MAQNGSTPHFTQSPADQSQWRAPTLQQSSNMRGLLRSGRMAIGNCLSYPSRHVAKSLAVTGADCCWIDAEHVAWSQKQLVECIQIIIHESGGKMIPVVRVPSKTAFDYMAWCLDAGAGGIIIPHLDTPEEMKAVIGACRFPPNGHRSFPPFTFIPGVTDATPEGEALFSLANKHVAIIPQIESRVGIKNLEAIVSLDEVDAFMIGAADLRLDMGLTLNWTGDEPEFVSALDKASKVSKERAKPLVGLAIGADMVKLRVEQGFRLIIVAMDVTTLVYGTIRDVGDARQAAEEHMGSLYKLNGKHGKAI